MDNPNLGQIIEGDKQKDAVHIAIAPVAAAERLSPGQDAGFLGEAVGVCKEPIGIVDPFLKGPVFKGERFWLFLYPGTITSLRHDWKHPAFEGRRDFRTSSQAWILDFAKSVGLTYEDLMQGAAEFLDTGDYLNRGGLLESETVPDEFWDHYQAVTGTKVPASERQSFFTCSC